MYVDLPPSSPGQLDDLERRIDAYLRRARAEHPVVEAVERGEPGERRWYVRLRGEEKDLSTVWLTLGQRSLHVETYVMPAPEENEADLYLHLLRRNRQARGLWFAVGDEDALYLVGQLPHALVDDAQLDRLLGSVYQYVEAWFRPAMRIGFASKFRG